MEAVVDLDAERKVTENKKIWIEINAKSLELLNDLICCVYNEIVVLSHILGNTSFIAQLYKFVFLIFYKLNISLYAWIWFSHTLNNNFKLKSFKMHFFSLLYF
jgi:hypothetical protein